MKGDKYVGWMAIFVAGWLTGGWNAKYEAQKPPVETKTRVLQPSCAALEYPATRKAARLWAQRHENEALGVILK